MQRTTSADGTEIAYTTVGTGPVVVVVNGAMSTARDAAGLADSLAAAGFTAVAYDRRARGSSGDARASGPSREADDLAAVIDAVGGRATVLGHSSGAVLALFAAASGAAIERLFLSEPPFLFDEDEPPAYLPDRLQALVDDGKQDEAIVTFQLEGVRLPPAMVEQIRSSPMFADLIPLAQSTVYDAALQREVPVPSPDMLTISQPVTVLLGSQTFPLLDRSARRLADLIPQAELVEVPEMVGHRPDPEALSRIVAARLG